MHLATLLLPWGVVAFLAFVAVAASERAIRSDTIFRVLWLAVGFVWACPFFVIFTQWVTVNTPFAFGGPMRSRYGPSSVVSTALLSLVAGFLVVYAFSKVRREKR
jgi:hypothetical protein